MSLKEIFKCKSSTFVLQLIYSINFSNCSGNQIARLLPKTSLGQIIQAF